MKEATLSDKYIIDNCTKIYSDFLTNKSKTKLSSLIGAFDKQGNIPSAKVDEIEVLWKDLLSDAISFLKFKDKREFDYDKADGKRNYDTSKEKVYERDQIAFGIDKLFQYFIEFRNFEALLYGADKFYRDHVLHVFRVWLIGVWLIEKFNFKLHWDFKKLGVKQQKKFFISFDEILAMWCIIALTHDLGYPLDKVKQVKEKVNGMMSYFGGNDVSEQDFQIPTHHHFINDFILRFISSKLIEITPNKKFKTAIQTKFYLKFSRSFENFNHGIISCVVLMKNLIYFLESDFDMSNPFRDTEDARQYCIRREILRAIACHTCTDIYHLHPNTLSFILILADELQTWDRPTFTELKRGKQKINISMYIPQISKEKITIKMQPIGSNKKDATPLFKQIFKKWHKWLRGALDGKDRKFVFELCFSVGQGKRSTTHKFLSKPGNLIEYYENNKKEDVRKLYI